MLYIAVTKYIIQYKSVAEKNREAKSLSLINTKMKIYKSRQLFDTKMKFYKSRQLLILFAPCLIYLLVFKYLPLWGILISFKDYKPFLGFSASEWVGFKYFVRFFNDPRAFLLVKNTFFISFYTLIFTFPYTIIFALIVNEVQAMKIKKIFQTITYLPHFISTVVVVGMLKAFLTPGKGLIINFLVSLGMKPIDLLVFPEFFRTLFVSTDIWQHTGWNAIIYFAAIAGINPELYEAATIDGANKLKQVLYITIPCIMPTIIVLLILRTGSLLSVGFEKALLMQVPATYSISDVISTYVYRQGLVGGEFSYSTAVGLFNSVINLLFLVIANFISGRLSENSLW